MLQNTINDMHKIFDYPYVSCIHGKTKNNSTIRNILLELRIKVFINSTSGVNLGQDYMSVEQQLTGRVQETCLKIIIFVILFSSVVKRKTEIKMHITVKLLCSKTSKQTEQMETKEQLVVFSNYGWFHIVPTCFSKYAKR